MSKKSAVEEQGATVQEAVRESWRPPLPLLICYAVVLLAGIGIYARRDASTENSLYDALKDCNASLRPKRERDHEENGLSEAYGVVQFVSQTGKIAEYLSLCDLQPELAAKIYRRTMKEGTSGAKMVALYSALFLANRKQLNEEDFKQIVALLESKGDDKQQNEIRKVAQRTFSDLTICTKLDAAKQFEVLPPNLPPKKEKAPAYKIQTREERFGDDQKVLGIRWSDADVAWAWWQAFSTKGKWDNQLQRFVVAEPSFPKLTTPEVAPPKEESAKQ